MVKGHTVVVILCFTPLTVLLALIVLAAFGIDLLTRANLPIL